MPTELVILLIVSVIGNIFYIIRHIKLINSPCCQMQCSISPRKDKDKETKNVAKAFMPSDSSNS